MIYLIETTYYNKTTGDITDLLKIGYSGKDSISKRMSSYKVCNPCYQLLCIVEGDEVIEKRLHRKFNKFLFPEYGNEWFYYNDEIVEFIKTGDFSNLGNSLREDLEQEQLSSITYLSGVFNILPESINLNRLGKIKTRQGILKELVKQFPDKFKDLDSKKSLLFEFLTTPTISKRLKLLCRSPKEDVDFVLNNLRNDDIEKTVLSILSQKKVVALGYNITDINKEIEYEKNILI